jgi:hypothetical protein
MTTLTELIAPIHYQLSQKFLIASDLLTSLTFTTLDFSMLLSALILALSMCIWIWKQAVQNQVYHQWIFTILPLV